MRYFDQPKYMTMAMAITNTMTMKSLLIALTLLRVAPTLLAFTPLTLVSQPSLLSWSLQAATTNNLPDGLFKTISKAGTGPLLRRGDVATVKYSCYLPNQPPFSKATSQKVVVSDANMIAGWETVIATMAVGERAIVRIPPSMAYGPAGVPPLIPGNAEIELDLEILESQPPVQLDFDALGYAEPNTPRSASAIADAYDIRRQNMVPEREGFDGWLDKARNYYFFGFFEGETGEQAPWFLRPSITFPIAFVIVGATFYVAFAFGGIKERGAQITDELDEIILSSLGMNPAMTIAMATAMAVGIVVSGSAPDLML